MMFTPGIFACRPKPVSAIPEDWVFRWDLTDQGFFNNAGADTSYTPYHKTDKNGNVVVFNQYSEVAISTNYGESFNYIDYTGNRVDPYGVATDGNGKWLCVLQTGGLDTTFDILVIENNGQSHYVNNVNIDIHSLISLDTDGQGTWIIGAIDEMYRSTDDGATWATVAYNTIPSDDLTGDISFLRYMGNNTWLAGFIVPDISSPEGDISEYYYVSSDSGTSWGKLDTFPILFDNSSFQNSVYTIDSYQGTWAVGTTERLLLSSDEGATWYMSDIDLVDLGNDVSNSIYQVVVVYGGGRLYVFSNGEGIFNDNVSFYTEDGGTTWQVLNPFPVSMSSSSNTNLKQYVGNDNGNHVIGLGADYNYGGYRTGKLRPPL